MQQRIGALPLGSVNNRSFSTLLCVFKKLSYTKLLVCPSNPHFTARPLSALQNCWRLSLFFYLREKKQNISRVVFRFTTKICPHWSRRTRRVIVAIWLAGSFSNSVFRAACLMERIKTVIAILLAASSERPPIRSSTR